MGRYDNVMQEYLIPLQKRLREALVENPSMSDEEIKTMVKTGIWGVEGMYETFISRSENEIHVDISFLVVPQEITIEIKPEKSDQNDNK